MEHKTLADKLDHIQKEDLGIHFDESLLWDDLSAQLGHKKSAFIERRLLIAACITLLILLFPIVLMMDSQPQQLASIKQEIGVTAVKEKPIDSEPQAQELVNVETNQNLKKTPLYTVGKKGVTLDLAEAMSIPKIDLTPIPILKEKKIERQLFADQDISIIQASLGTPSIEKEKSVTLRAQLHTSSQPVQLNNQALKIKLFDSSNQ